MAMRSESMFYRYFQKTKDYCADWKELGVLLSMEMPALKVIEADCPSNVTTCMIEMLHAWLESKDPANPEAKLNEALKKLKQKLSHDKEADFLKVDKDLEKEIKQLKGDFSKIAVAACRYTRKHYPNAQDAKVWLNEILRDRPQDPLVIRGDVRDHFKLNEQLQLKWHYTNPDILQRLVNEIGTEEIELAENMIKYKEEFKRVCALIPISEKKEVELEEYDPTKPCLILKITEVSDFPEIDVFLTEVFGIYKRYLRIHKIQSGCVQVTMQFDPSIEPFLRACIDKNYKVGKHKHIESLYIVTPEIVAISQNNEAMMLPQQVKQSSKPTQTKKQEMHKSSKEMSKKISELHQHFKMYDSQPTGGTKYQGARSQSQSRKVESQIRQRNKAYQRKANMQKQLI